MQTLSSYIGRARSFLASHKAARVALIAFLIIVLALIIFHPRGTKTYLVLGMDNYGSLDETGRSDVMLLAQVDFTHAKISAVTFARDMLVENENGKQVKLNTIVRNSGEEALTEAIERNFGLQIDGWFRVNFTTVIELVDAIGGADVELTSAEANYIDKNVGLYPDSPLSEGVCRLNGAQALCYARCRKLDNDLGRGERQNKLLSAMVQSTKRMTAANLVAVFNSLKHAWRSSLSGGEQAMLLGKALWLRGAKVQKIGVPFDGTWRYGESSIVPDMEENIRLLHEALDLPAVKAAPQPA